MATGLGEVWRLHDPCGLAGTLRNGIGLRGLEAGRLVAVPSGSGPHALSVVALIELSERGTPPYAQKCGTTVDDHAGATRLGSSRAVEVSHAVVKNLVGIGGGSRCRAPWALVVLRAPGPPSGAAGNYG